MILSPIQNTSKDNGGTWSQVRPRITQGFGENPHIYKQFGMDGHNGVDFGDNGDDNIFAPFEGVAVVQDSGSGGYGLHVRIKDDTKECVLGHLSEVNVIDGQNIGMGDKIGVMGDTGFSTGKHLHLGMRFLEDGQVLNYGNGYFGYVDPMPFMVWWKGAGSNTTLE